MYNAYAVQYENMRSILRQRGFTIVELLIVIVVIAILAAITIVAYNGIQTRAAATQVVSGVRYVDKAFMALATQDGRTTWWRDSGATDPIYVGAPGNPSIANIITNTELKLYLQQTPTTPATGTWQYDNDGDTRVASTCESVGSEGSGWTGVVLAVNGLTTAVINEVDRQLDDSNILCGKVRAGNAAQTTMLYQLDFGQSIE